MIGCACSLRLMIMTDNLIVFRHAVCVCCRCVAVQQAWVVKYSDKAAPLRSRNKMSLKWFVRSLARLLVRWFGFWFLCGFVPSHVQSMIHALFVVAVRRLKTPRFAIVLDHLLCCGLLRPDNFSICLGGEPVCLSNQPDSCL